MKARSLVKVVFFLLIVLPFTGRSQTLWIDSIKRVTSIQQPDTTAVITLLTISESYQHYYPDSALTYARKGLHMAEKLQYKNGIFFSIINIHKALYALGNYALDLDYVFKAKVISQQIHTPFALGWANGMLGDCYYNLGEYEKALHYYRQVIKIAEENALPDLNQIYSNLTPVFIKLYHYDSALFYAKKGYTLFKRNPKSDNVHDDEYARSFMFRFLGDAFAGKFLYDSALFYYHKSLPYSEDVNLELNKADVYNGMALVFISQDQLDSATYYAEKIFFVKPIRSYPMGSLQAANTLTAIYQIRNNSDSTLKYLRLALSIKDTLFSREKTMAVQNILFKEQEKQWELLATKAELKNRYTVYFISGFLIVIVVIGLIILRNRRVHQLQTIRNQIADDLHDDIGSTLSSISIMNELVKAKSGKESLPLLISIGENATAIQENMSDIVWTIQSGNDRFDKVFQRMIQFASDLLEAKNIDVDFVSDPGLSTLNLSMGQRKNFYLFFKEVITNAARHSEAKKVLIRIVKENHFMSMHIEDDGKGFGTTVHSNGNGMFTLKKRAAELNADFTIISHLSTGTNIRLKFKIT